MKTILNALSDGCVGVRARVPSRNGLLSTFLPFRPGGNQHEVDILEYLGREPEGTTQSCHYRDRRRHRLRRRGDCIRAWQRP